MRRAAALLAAALVVPAAPAAAAPASITDRFGTASRAAALGVPAAAPAAVTWTVQPAAAGGPDGRRWIEHTLDPGEVITEHLAVRNFSAAEATFELKAADGYLTDKGRFNMLPSDQVSADGGTWISVRDSVSVPARSTKVVPFTITVPDDATPGDHPAGIAATVAGKQGTVRVESRVGFRVLLRASGTLRPALAANEVQARYQRSWNPLRPGVLHVTYVAVNTGNVRLDPRARVESRDLFGSAAVAPVGELLPGDSRAVAARVSGVWGLGPVRTKISFTPADGMPSAELTTWVVPWPQLLLVAAVVGLILTLRAVNRIRRRRLESLLAQARLEGARSVS